MWFGKEDQGCKRRQGLHSEGAGNLPKLGVSWAMGFLPCTDENLKSQKGARPPKEPGTLKKTARRDKFEKSKRGATRS